MSGINVSQIHKKNSPNSANEEKGLFDFMNKDISFGGNAFGDKKKEAFYNELGVLLEAGIDIRSALDILVKEQENAKDKELLNKILNDVVDGSSLSDALNTTDKFSPYEYYSLKIGEETGKIGAVLKQLSDYYNKRIKQRRQLVSAFSYPIIVLCTAVGAVSFMMYFIVPMFADVFNRFGGDLPAVTKFVIRVSGFFSAYFLWILMGIGGTIFALYQQRNKLWFRKTAARIIVRVPIFGPMIRKMHLARFCSVMALLIGAKIPLLRALQLTSTMIRFYPIEESLQTIEKDIVQGTSLHKSMEAYKIFYPRMISLIKVGEEVNKLDTFFDKIANQYTDEVEHQTAVMGNLIEPLMLIFLGAVVGTILIAMYLPLFSLSTSFS